jgi:hypothetical protein
MSQGWTVQGKDYVDSRVDALSSRVDREINLMRIHYDAILAEKDKALSAALKSQQDLAEKHNDLIRAGEKDRENFVTKDTLSSALVPIEQNIARNTLDIGFMQRHESGISGRDEAVHQSRLAVNRSTALWISVFAVVIPLLAAVLLVVFHP